MLLLISFQIQYMAGLIDFLGKFKRFGDAAGIPVPAVCFDGLLVAAFQLTLIEFQRFLLGSLGGVGHLALMRFFYAINTAGTASADEYFSEETASGFVL